MNKLQGEILTLPKMVGSVGAKTVFVGGGDGGENGATFYPAVSDDGVISWTNNKGLSNPTPVNIKGPAGPAGPQGEKGAAGPQGPQGNPGAKGDKGDTGPKGETGETGPAGADGQPGKDGADGKDGSPGADGFSPTVSVTDITGGHRVTITDKDGDKTFDVMDGEGGTGGSVEGGGRTTHRGKIITIWEHTFDEDVTDTSTFDDDTADYVYGNNKVYTTDEDGNPLKIRRVWYEIYWATGSSAAATATPSISIGHVDGVDLSEMFIQNLHQEKRIVADRGSRGNNIDDGQYRYGYLDWEKIESVEYSQTDPGWRGTFSQYNCYPTANQVRFALTKDYADCVAITMPGVIKAGTKYVVWAEVSE